MELRVWVLAAILVGEVAVLTTGYFGPLTGVLVPLLTAVAFFVSHHRRREKNILIKVMLAFFALALLAVFFREALSSLYDTRVPLARLFLWVQVIHAFDLPARKDTTYSLLSGLILLDVGAVLSTNLFYGLFIIAFLFCASGALTQLHLLGSPRARGGGGGAHTGSLARCGTAGRSGGAGGRFPVLLPPAVAPGYEPYDAPDELLPAGGKQLLRGRPEPGLPAAGRRPVLPAPLGHLAGLLPRLQPVHGPAEPRAAL